MSSRLTSAIFVSALIRRVNGEGGFAAVVRHGSDEAGAIFICVPGGFGEGTTLFAQAPQAIIADRDAPPSGGRLFEKIAEGELVDIAATNPILSKPRRARPPLAPRRMGMDPAPG